jgi:hypothetical protein
MPKLPNKMHTLPIKKSGRSISVLGVPATGVIVGTATTFFVCTVAVGTNDDTGGSGPLSSVLTIVCGTGAAVDVVGGFDVTEVVFTFSRRLITRHHFSGGSLHGTLYRSRDVEHMDNSYLMSHVLPFVEPHSTSPLNGLMRKDPISRFSPHV